MSCRVMIHSWLQVITIDAVTIIAVNSQVSIKSEPKKEPLKEQLYPYFEGCFAYILK